MSIMRKGNQKNKGNRNRAHDSPEGNRDAFKRAKKPGEIECIEDWLKSVKFKKVSFGGVSETDVWKKISELNEMYETALTAERARYNMLLDTYAKREGRQAVRRGQSGQAVPKSEFAQDVPDMTREVPLASRSRDAPAQAVRRTQKRPEGAASKPRIKEIPEDETGKSVQRTAPPRRKSAKPSGAPYIRTDWLDDEDEETIFDIESGLHKNSSRFQ